MALKEIRTLLDAEKFDEALATLDKLLARDNECPHLWNLRGDLIQLLDTEAGPPLSEAGRSYEKALAINPDDLEALECLAHFYDAIDPEPVKAKQYAAAYISRAKRGLAEMERVLAEES